MERWKMVTLGDLVDVNYGKGLSQKNRLPGAVPVFGANGIVDYHNTAITQGETIIIGRKGSAGAVNWSDRPCWPIDTTFFIDSFHGNVFPKFLYYVLRNQELEKLQQSAAIPGLNRDLLRNTSIPLPYPNDPARSLAEQRRIVARLEALLGETRAMRERVQTMRRLWDEFMQAALAEVFPRQGQDLPVGWEWRALGDSNVCQIVMGQSPPGHTYNLSGQGLPFFQGKADFGEIHPTPSKWCTIAQRVSLPGDVLVSVRAPVGPTNLTIGKCIIGRGLAALRPTNRVVSKYLLYAIRSQEGSLSAMGTGSTFGAISKSQLSSFTIPLPYPNDPARSLAEQRRIVARLEALQAEVDAARRALEDDERRIAQMEQAILTAAFRGEL